MISIFRVEPIPADQRKWSRFGKRDAGGCRAGRGFAGCFGFTLPETLLVLAVCAILAAVAVFSLSGPAESVRQTRLTSDVATVNAAIQTYLTNGGSLNSAATGQDVMATLKTRAAEAQVKKLPSLRGSMVDARLTGVEVTTDGEPRAVWDNVKKRFVVGNKGAGFREFLVDRNAAVTEASRETRTMPLPLGTESKWVWDFQDATGPSRAPPVTPGMVFTRNPDPAGSPGLLKLAPPEFSKTGGVYDYAAFDPDLEVILTDPNPGGASQMYYSVGGGAWAAWNGTPLSVPRALVTTVRAYSQPLNPDVYTQSDLRAETYETVYFSGLTTGLFTNPRGDTGMYTNLTRLVRNAWGTYIATPTGEKKTTFEWGDPASGYTRPNSLVFTNANFTEIAPDQTFELGRLTYYNGTVYTGTIANSVDFEVDMYFSVPGASEELTFTFNLMSTVNEGRSADADADYVYIPRVSTRFSTIIKGRAYYLVLSFGQNDLTNGFTTINTFHTHENKTATGSLYGRFTTTPPQT